MERRKHSREFKLEAVNLVRERGGYPRTMRLPEHSGASRHQPHDDVGQSLRGASG